MPVSWRTSGDKERAKSHISEAQRLLAQNQQFLLSTPAQMNFKSFERLDDGTEILIRSFRGASIVSLSRGVQPPPIVTNIVDIKSPFFPMKIEEGRKELRPEKEIGLFVGGGATGSLWRMEGWIGDKQKWGETGAKGDNIGFLAAGQGSRAFAYPCYDVAVDDTGVYFAGGRELPDYHVLWRAEKRDLKNGSLIWEMEGQADTQWGWESIATGVKVAGENVYIGGCCNGSEIFAAKLNKETGALIWQQSYIQGFIDAQWDGHGLVTFYISDMAVAPDETFLYMGGEVESYNLDGQNLQRSWVIQKIDCINGGNLGYAEEVVALNDPHNVNALEVDAEGVYEGGNVYQYGLNGLIEGFGWRIVKRSHGGSVIWDRHLPPTTTPYYSGIIYDIALDYKYVYVIGDESELPCIRCFLKEDGSSVWEVKGGAGQGFGVGIVVVNDSLYICGWDGLIEKRKKKDGSLIKVINETGGDFYRCAAIEL